RHAVSKEGQQNSVSTVHEDVSGTQHLSGSVGQLKAKLRVFAVSDHSVSWLSISLLLGVSMITPTFIGGRKLKEHDLIPSTCTSQQRKDNKTQCRPCTKMYPAPNT